MEQQYTVQDVTCTNCGYIRRVSPDVVESIIKDFKCELCYVEPGKAKLVLRVSKCAACGQVMKDNHRYCFCKDKPGFKIQTNVWDKKGITRHRPSLKNQYKEEGEVERLLKTKVELARLEPQRIQNEILKELQKLNAPKKSEPVKITKVNHGAIG